MSTHVVSYSTTVCVSLLVRVMLYSFTSWGGNAVIDCRSTDGVALIEFRSPSGAVLPFQPLVPQMRTGTTVVHVDITILCSPLGMEFGRNHGTVSLIKAYKGYM